MGFPLVFTWLFLLLVAQPAVEGDVRTSSVRVMLPDISWSRVSTLRRLVETNSDRYTLEDFLRETDTLELYQSLPDSQRLEPEESGQILNLLIALLLGPYITPMLASGISPQCLNHSWAYATSILDLNNTWALRMFDSDGKLPDGVFSGNLNPVGVWDACLAVEANDVDSVAGLIPLPSSNFRGKYCRPRFTTETAANESADTREQNPLGIEPALPAILPLSVAATQSQQAASVGLCIPSSCSAEDLRKSLQNRLHPLTVSLKESDCHVKGESTDYSAGDIVMLVILIITALLMIVGTFTDVVKSQAKKHEDSKYAAVDQAFRARMPNALQRFLIAFSLWTNVRKLLDTTPSKDTLGCLHGMRFLSMTWVLLGHQYVFGLFSVGWVNTFLAFDVTNSVAFSAVLNATVSVDSFFFLSGLLVTYIFMRNIERTEGKFNILMYYVHRYIRLTPVLAMVIGFVATLYSHLGEGPFWGQNTAEENTSHQLCMTKWWKNLLYINNLYESDFTCLAQTWYLANDMQMFVFSPVVLLPLYYWPTLGQVWIILLTSLSIFVTGYITDENNFVMGGGGDSFQKLYAAPWCRIGAYLVGMYTGWILHRFRGRRLRLSFPAVLLGWLTASLTACLVLYGTYNYNTIPPQAVPAKSTSIIYTSLQRPVWAACLAWVVIACVHGYGGFINTLLCWNFWIPLSRVTYCCYLVSIDIQIWLYATLKSTPYFDQTLAVYFFLGTLVVSVFIAAIFSMAFEAPMLAIEKIIFANVGVPKPKTQKAELKETEDIKPSRTVAGHDNAAYTNDTVGSETPDPEEIVQVSDIANGGTSEKPVNVDVENTPA